MKLPLGLTSGRIRFLWSRPYMINYCLLLAYIPIRLYVPQNDTQRHPPGRTSSGHPWEWGFGIESVVEAFCIIQLTHSEILCLRLWVMSFVVSMIRGTTLKVSICRNFLIVKTCIFICLFRDFHMGVALWYVAICFIVWLLVELDSIGPEVYGSSAVAFITCNAHFYRWLQTGQLKFVTSGDESFEFLSGGEATMKHRDGVAGRATGKSTSCSDIQPTTSHPFTGVCKRQQLSVPSPISSYLLFVYARPSSVACQAFQAFAAVAVKHTRHSFFGCVDVSVCPRVAKELQLTPQVNGTDVGILVVIHFRDGKEVRRSPTLSNNDSTPQNVLFTERGIQEYFRLREQSSTKAERQSAASHSVKR